MTIERDVELRVGRRSADGTIRISKHTRQLVQLSVSYKGERASSVVLTRSQVQALQQALAEYESAMATDEEIPEPWNGNERRTE